MVSSAGTRAPTSISRWRTAAFEDLHRALGPLLGEKTTKHAAALGLQTVGDLLQHLPRRWMLGTETSDLSLLEPGEEAAVLAEVTSSDIRGGGQKMRLEVRVSDGRGRLRLTFFGRSHLINHWASLLHKGARGIFAGKVGMFRDELQLSHPDFVIIDEGGSVVGGARRNEGMGRATKGGLIGLYPASRSLPTWKIAECVNLVLEQIQLSEPWPQWVCDEAGVIGLPEAVRRVHQPTERSEIEAGVERLRFDEAFATQLAMAYRRADAAAHGAVPRPRRSGGLLDAFDAQLPFRLTAGQQEVSDEIFADLAAEHPMQRLLQGEVGSGKTLVALRAMLAVVDAGGQAVLLAPTEVLATQHAQTLARDLGDLALGGTLAAPEQATRVVCLTGSMTAAQKREALLHAASGEAGIIVGTHALLSETVQFAELGLVVVDEQHRFGVEQRAALDAKAEKRPHVLVMTATPIPRSVAMTVFGDLTVSTLTEIPAGRSEVLTVVVDQNLNPAWVERAWQRIIEEVDHGRQAFVVCPRISAEGAEGGRGVEETFAELSTGPLADLRVEMLHGQQPTEDKETVMAAFAAGEVDVLVATTVVEVGVDVPNASVMVICDADHFGISQLHQLRGRIGRGAHPGVCLLLTGVDPDSDARARLDAVAATRDGFALADVDLEQRREGDVLGSSQSGGRSGLRLLRVLRDAEQIAIAREVAAEAVRRDPDQSEPGFADAVRHTELIASGEWLTRN
ncbi:ATP-dependent DNA helicase RecG [Propionibacteriaceae bacterium Y1685]|uniref:ATP-dependent DNA helicase RecG n=1 Tax=Microlunatus sp. Y1700 TaxID=3418487 RepID=UPI003B823051